MRFRWIVGFAVVFAAGAARADYYSHPDLHPANRCADIPAGIGDENDPGGAGSIHCQRLFWDLPPVLEVGRIGVAERFAEDPAPQFPRGITDRPPPIFRGDTNGDGIADEGFELQADCEANATGCERLCSDPLMIPYWKELLDENGQPVTGPDDFNYSEATSAPGTGDLEGPQFQVSCIYGSRSYYGPWQTGATVDPAACKAFLVANPEAEVIDGPCGNTIFDRIASTQAIRFENTERLNYFQTLGGERFEWNIGSEYYNHYGSHHGTCSAPTHDCGRGGNGRPAEDYEEGGACWDQYSYLSHGPDERGDGEVSRCWAGDADPRCNRGKDQEGNNRAGTSGFRNATQIPGRLSVPLPNKEGEERGVQGAEDQFWGCNHHVVTQLPPGSYGVTSRYINYRLQTGGVRNDHPTDTIWGAAPGDFYGGAVGEMIIQYFVKPATADVRPINISFNAAADGATTMYPPFTWNYHESEWVPPFDSQIALNAIHSHHRMVKGVMNVAPVNPPRLNAHDPNCGGPQPNGAPSDLYTSWEWEDAPVCQYWKEDDGPVPLRKGQTLRTTCYVNNGVTPEAIKHGLVAGATVEVLKALGAPIPEYPETMPADTWGDPLRNSPVGTELLYGTHPPLNYRVVYKCSSNGMHGDSMVQFNAFVEGRRNPICNPNPATDADGDYIDGAYVNGEQCGEGGVCEPGSIVFACVGEEEMCIGVSMYWAMPRLGSDSNDEALENLAAGNVNDVGTPGNAGTETDISGICTECGDGPGL